MEKTIILPTLHEQTGVMYLLSTAKLVDGPEDMEKLKKGEAATEHEAMLGKKVWLTKQNAGPYMILWPGVCERNPTQVTTEQSASEIEFVSPPYTILNASAC